MKGSYCYSFGSSSAGQYVEETNECDTYTSYNMFKFPSLQGLYCAIPIFNHTGGGRTFSELIFLCEKELVPVGKFSSWKLYSFWLILLENDVKICIFLTIWTTPPGYFNLISVGTLENLRWIPPMVKKWNSPMISIYDFYKNLLNHKDVFFKIEQSFSIHVLYNGIRNHQNSLEENKYLTFQSYSANDKLINSISTVS